MVTLADTHAHLEMDQFDSDRDTVITRAYDSGVHLIIDVGATLEGSRKAVELASDYPFIYASVGVHPHDAKDFDDFSYEELKKLIQQKKVIAIGETGLDYFKEFSSKKAQKEVFEKHIHLANEFNKPLIIHSRDAKEDTLEILRSKLSKNSRGILHCFSGDLDMAKKAMDMGFYISFAGPVTYPKAEELRVAAKEIPLDMILVETDCPYLSPQQQRGKRNEPSYVKFVAEKIAEIKGITLEKFSDRILANVKNLFGIEPEKRNRIFTYKIRNSIYINLTNRCTNNCIFCDRSEHPVVKGYNLKLDLEPSSEEIINEIGDPSNFEEIVFCGFGEPTLRFEVLKEVAREVKKRGARVRLNTNGQGNLINKRDILPELGGLIDSVSISLNSENEIKYMELNQPEFKNGVYEAVKDFAKEAKKYIPNVAVSVVDIQGKVNVEECRHIADNLGVKFKVRKYNEVG